MRNTTLSRLALLGLASVSAIAFAANTITGEIRFDGRFTTSQKGTGDSSVPDNLEKPDNLFVSRARLNFMGDVAKSWTYGIRLEYPEHENQQLISMNSDAAAVTDHVFLDEVATLNAIDASISRAYLAWSGIENINIMMGRIGCPEITADRLYYQPFVGSYPNNMAVGSVIGYAGNHAGFSIDGKAGPIGYAFGFWKQTGFRKLESVTMPAVAASDPTSFTDFQQAVATGPFTSASNFDTKSLRLGYGGRLSFANKMNGTTSYGLAVGYNQAPMNMPVVVATVGSFDDTTTSGDEMRYGVSGFNTLSNFAVDGSVAFGAFQVNAGYQNQKLKNDTATNAIYNSAGGASQVFQNDGKATSWWIEGGYLIMGDSYKFDEAKAVVSGVKLRENQAGLEIVARYGNENRRNVLALTNAVGYSDFTGSVQSGAAQLIGAQIVDEGTSNKYMLISADNSLTNTTSANKGAVQIVVSDEKAYESKSSGYAVALKYYFTEAANATLEFENRSNEFNRISANSADQDSLYSDSVSTIRLQAAFSF